ncbi:MAG: hypothetical protein KDB04_04275 [Acidimicrobiales bacterium]|nr:hypothetical protein [Acidimicrobiales bacterium]HRW39749.1 hypothetical protein [Aquihabitans sp.]
MPDDPIPDLDRLAHLAPAIDLDAAAGAFRGVRRRRARRRTALVGAAGVLAAVGLGALVVSAQDDAADVSTGPSSTPSVSAGFEGGRQVTTSEDGLVLQLDLPETAVVGERMWLDVTFTNGSDDDITVGTAAPCDEQLGAVAGSLDAIRAVEADAGMGAFAVDPLAGSGVAGEQWGGDVDDLPAVLAGGRAPKVLPGRPEAQLSMTTVACSSMLLPPRPLATGASLSTRLAVDLRWTDPGSADGSELEVLASTGPLATAAGDDLGRVSVRQPVALVDPTDRAPSHAVAVGPDGIAAAPTLDAWLAETRDLPPQVEQRWSAAVAWWRGAWEAWIVPTYGSGHQSDPLRIRFDPEAMAVTDVRTVFWNGAPSDDPDAYPIAPDEPVDEVRYSAG